MSHLTIEKMDRINFLITEVSLECLGNKFFDIYGNQADSLLHLISANSLKAERTDVDDESSLWKSLTTKKKKKIIVPIEKKILPNIVTNESRKRRASFSNTNEEPDTSNDPESLLVPMAPKAAKIMNRRSTIAIQAVAKGRKQVTLPPGPKSRKKIIEAALAKKAQLQAQAQAQLQTKRNRMPTSDAPPVIGASIAEIQDSIRNDTNARYNSMRLLSETQEEKYRTLNINPNMADFYDAERRNLFTQCNTLVKFIDFIRQDGDNAIKLANVSNAILELIKEY